MLENLTPRLLETTSLLATCLLELPQQLPPHGERRTGRNCSTTRALASPSPLDPPRLLSRCPLSTSSLAKNGRNTIEKLRGIDLNGYKKYSW